MSLPILVTPAAKPPQAKPLASAAPSDKSAFSQALGAAERRAEPSKPTAVEPEVAPEEAKLAQPTPDETPQAEVALNPEQTPANTPVAPAPVDLQMLLAVASQVMMPVAQPLAQPVAVEAPPQAAVAMAPQVETPVQVAVPVVQQAVAEQVKPADVAPKGQSTALPAGEVPVVAVDPQAAIAPALQPETGGQQESSEDPDAQLRKDPKPPVMPVATQQVPQSLESLRASDKVSTLVTAAHGPESATQAPVARVEVPVQEAAATALVAEVAREGEAPVPATEAVRPWQLPHAVGGQAPQAQPLENGAPTGEPMPMREAMRMPFTQAAKEPGKPSELRLQLSPEHLGRMEIRVMSHEGTLSAQIRVDHAQAREMMQVQLAELRQSLADQGIKIDRLEVSVGQDPRRGEQSFAFGGGLQQQAGQQQQQAHQASSGRLSYYGDESLEEIAEEAQGLTSAAGATAVDYQA